MAPSWSWHEILKLTHHGINGSIHHLVTNTAYRPLHETAPRRPNFIDQSIYTRLHQPIPDRAQHPIHHTDGSTAESFKHVFEINFTRSQQVSNSARLAQASIPKRTEEAGRLRVIAAGTLHGVIEIGFSRADRHHWTLVAPDKTLI